MTCNQKFRRSFPFTLRKNFKRMFDNNTNIFYFDYEVQLDTIVKAVCEISVDIGKQLQTLLEIKEPAKGFSIIDLFNSDFLLEMSIREEEILDRVDGDGNIIEGINAEGFISKIATYFNNNIFQFPDFDNFLNGSEILVLSKEDSKLLTIGDKPKDRLLAAVKKLKVLKILISKLKHDSVRLSLEKLEIFETDLFYKGVITTNRLEGQPIIPLIDVSLLRTDNLASIIIDKELCWINEAKFKSFDAEFSISADVYLLTDPANDIQIGLLSGNHLIPYADVDLSDYILEERLGDYFYLLFDHTYSKGKVQSPSKSDLLKRFIEDVKTEELNRLLTYLKNNFYIDNAEIVEKFKDYFSTVVTLDKLDHLDGYQFLVSTNTGEETALGIYSEKKAGTSYNLLHWLNHEDENKMRHYRKEVPDKRNKKQISSLKPEICYYFLEKYFEDLVEGILKTNDYKYIPNLVLHDNKIKGVEIDSLVQVGNKFYYIEEKTKLTRFYIEDFLKKSSEMIKRFDKLLSKNIDIEFILLSSFSDSTVKDYQYFIDESPASNDGYNTSREGINCIPYYFAVPIPDREGRKITCISEPEYTKLQELIVKICPK